MLVVAFGLAGCGATDQGDGEENVGELSQELITSCPAGWPSGGGQLFVGGPGNDTFMGTPFADCMIGHGGNDTLIGNAGSDYLVGGAGDDNIFGGDGDDVIAPETGNDTVFGGDGADTINSLNNSGGNDILHGDGGNDYILGGNGNDEVYGEAGNDLLKAGPGNDLVEGGDGNDNMEGGIGDDTMNGGIGDDKVYGQDGNDTLNGDVGTDFIFGGNGDDTINGGDGGDTLRGEAGIDTINGENDNDAIYGGTEGDILHGNAGNDHLYGEDGNDQLFGDAGDDRLIGGAGLDTIQGGLGNDLVNESGGGGNVTGDAGNDAIAQTTTANGSLGTDACTGLSCELAEPPITCSVANQCGAGRRCATEVNFCIYCQSDSECAGGATCVPTLGCRVQEDCTNAIDDDGDGAVDCTDLDCQEVTACKTTQIGFGGGPGSWHGCVKSSTGTPWCWGRNHCGQLGFNGADGSAPAASAGVTTATDVKGGSANSCVLLATGAVQCWGSSSYGALGDAGAFTGQCTKAPQDVLAAGGMSGLLTGATQLTVGASHGCALIGSPGSITCWGGNTEAQLGDGTGVNRPTPVSVLNITTALQVSGGSQNTCAVLANGTVQCWGRNHRGQLGTGSPGTTSNGNPVTVVGISNAAQVATGQDFACARTFAGGVQCWGDNQRGELGNGVVTATRITTPVTANLGAPAVSIAAGAFHMCAILQGGAVSCWGLNADGQVGIGVISATQATPVATSPLQSAVSLEMGRDFTCAKALNGTVTCWGDNRYGQIGNTDVGTDHPTPTTKTGLPAL